MDRASKRKRTVVFPLQKGNAAWKRENSIFLTVDKKEGSERTLRGGECKKERRGKNVF